MSMTPINEEKKMINNIKILRVPSILDGIALYEKVDLELLKELIESDVLMMIKNKKENEYYENNQMHLMEYKKNYILTKKMFKTKYKLNETGYGRVNSVKSLLKHVTSTHQKHQQNGSGTSTK